MQVALLRVGIDKGSGGIYGPLFEDGSFEYIPIPDEFGPGGKGVDSRTYGNTPGRQGRSFIDYFPQSRQNKMEDKSLHFDPEFETFTYGDPTEGPKVGLRRLKEGDLLAFYCGLKGWGFQSPQGLYLMGFFEVQTAGIAEDFSEKEIDKYFKKNFHVRHPSVFERQRKVLVLVKGSPRSRLLSKAVLISSDGKDRAGTKLKILSPEKQKIFGHFEGHVSIQRSTPRWVRPEFVGKASDFIWSLG
jgi:hypothetical protein